MNATERRLRLRDHLASDTCVRPASVFDPISARIAESLGFTFGMLGGSVASAVILGAPDLAVMTQTELASQVRRITRASSLSMLVDADHGYGNALNAMRTVEELEAAGASGMTIEDTVLPARFGSGGVEELISPEEMTGKLRAAVAGRQDPATVVLGRTHALNAEGLDGALRRVEAYARTGVDAIFLMGVKDEKTLESIRGVTDLPFMLGSTPASLTSETLATHGVRVVLRGHPTLGAFVQAVRDVLAGQAEGRNDPPAPDADVMAIASGRDQWRAWQQAFLG